MRMMYPILFRQQGARFATQMMDLDRFQLTEFPKSSVFHVYDDGDNNPNVDTSKPWYRGYSLKILLEQVTDYKNPIGQFRRPSFDFGSSIRPWKRQHAKTWQITDKSWMDNRVPDQLCVVNYGYLDKFHQYTTTPMSGYYRWLNTQKTIFSKMAEIAEASDRQQFFILKVPAFLQGMTMLNKFQGEPDTLMKVNVFGAYEMDGFYELAFWQWLGVTHRGKSLLSLIPEKHYKKINFILEGKNGKQVLINLAYLNSWIKGQKNDTEITSPITYTEVALQKLFLRLLIQLNGELAEESGDGVEIKQRNALFPKPPVPIQTVIEDTTDDPSQLGEITDTGEDDDDEDKGDGVEAALSGLKPMNDNANAPMKLLTDDQIEQQLAKKSSPSDENAALFKDIEKDLEALDKIALTRLKNQGVSTKEVVPEPSQLAQKMVPDVDEMAAIDPKVVQQAIYQPKSSSEVLLGILAESAEANLLTAADYRRMSDGVRQYEASPDPYGSGKPRHEAKILRQEDTVIQPEEEAIVIKDNVPDKSMGKSSLKPFHKKYLKHVMKKDVLRMVDHIQAGGVVIRRHEVEVSHSVLGSYEHHRLELKPFDGQPSVVNFSYPIPSDDGTFMAAGNKYLMRSQRFDLPIRKIAPTIVGLTSYYGKTFVQRSPKMVNSSLNWLFRRINLAIVTEGSYLHGISPGNVANLELKQPFIYQALGSEYESLWVGPYFLSFNYEERTKLFSDGDVTTYEKNDRIVCGIHGNQGVIVVDKASNFFLLSEDGETPLGDVYQFLQLPVDKSPVDFAELKVFSKYIPVGIVLAYYLGFDQLLAFTETKYRVLEPRRQKNLEPYEYPIVFKDKTLIFDRRDTVSSLLLAGFLEFDKQTKLYEFDHFNHKQIYLNLLMSRGFTTLYIRELDNMENLFIDPITAEILEKLKLPVTFKGVLVESTKRLTTFNHPVTQDRSVMRNRGYERFSGAVYKELVQAIRQFRSRNIVGRSKIDMSPFQVWNAIMKDNSIKIVEDINPIQNLKETEVITFSGEGGRSRETMTKPTRAFHHSNLGDLSESSVDSFAVGTVAYMSADPNLADVRGMMKEEKSFTPTNMTSTAALISAGSFTDNPKRISFITTQHGHTIASPAYRQPQVRTGYEAVIGHRTSKLFCTTAEEDGVVESVSKEGLMIKYKNGEKDGIALGRHYGRAEGSIYPHDIVTPLKAGQAVKKGDVLAYNTKFFEPDYNDPSQVVSKLYGEATVMFVEQPSTHEDSCTISPSLSQQLGTETTKMKSYTVRFGQNLLDVRKPGDSVKPLDVLMVIEDEITAKSQDYFSDESLASLKRLANASPKAGVTGVVEKIEVYYHGDKADMTESLRRLADQSDSAIAKHRKATGQPVVSGRVTNEYRVSGVPLELDQAEVRIYITVKAISATGDKLVFGHQMKTTIAEVHPGQAYTESGRPIDAEFSYYSVGNRQVHSVIQIGSTAELLDEAARRAMKLYFKD